MGQRVDPKAFGGGDGEASAVLVEDCGHHGLSFASLQTLKGTRFDRVDHFQTEALNGGKGLNRLLNQARAYMVDWTRDVASEERIFSPRIPLDVIKGGTVGLAVFHLRLSRQISAMHLRERRV